jgi:hypothetical protein
MTMTLPSFASLKTRYPTDDDPAAVKNDIGGEVNAEWITNTCVIRMSKAFNYAGGAKYEIPRTEHLLTVKGDDKKNYAIRVAEFIEFLNKTYGTATIIRSGKDISIDHFKNKTGIVAWHVSGWSDATGHFTLWNLTEGLYEGGHHYFSMPLQPPAGGGPWLTKAELWPC